MKKFIIISLLSLFIANSAFAVDILTNNELAQTIEDLESDIKKFEQDE